MALRSQDLRAEGAVVYQFPIRVRSPRGDQGARRRRVPLALVAVGVVAAVVVGGGPSGQAPAASRSGAPRSVVLQEGDTIWEVAQRFAPPSIDVRAYVDTILESNGWEAPPPPGTRLVLPR